MNDQQQLRYSRHILLNEIGMLLIGVERGLSGKLLSINALDMNIMRSALARDPHCRVCGNSPTATVTAGLVDASPPQQCRSGSRSC